MTQGHSALLATSEALERIERLNPHYCALATVMQTMRFGPRSKPIRRAWRGAGSAFCTA